HGVTTLLWGKATGGIPSSSGSAPRPPCGTMSTTKRPYPSSSPRSLKGQIEPLPACARCPTSGQIAPKITWLMLFVVFARVFTGYGNDAFRIEPGGALTCSGLNRPSLFGTSGTSAHLKG